MVLSVRVSQLPVQVVSVDPQNVRISQLPVLVVDTSPQNAYVSQLAAIVVYNEPQDPRVSQLSITVVLEQEEIDPKSLIPVSPVIENWRWQSIRTESYSGVEQIMALRDQPFMEFEYNLALQNDNDRNVIVDLLHRKIGDNFAYPMFHHSTDILQTSNSGATDLVFDPTKTDLRVGEQALVFDFNLNTYELVMIASLDANGCAITEPLTFNVTTNMQICPAPDCRIPEATTLNFTKFSGTVNFMPTAIPERQLKRPNQNIVLETVNGLPYLDKEPISGPGIGEQLTYNLQSIDIVQQIPKQFRTYETAKWIGNRSYLEEDKELDYWREFGNQIKGSLGYFYLPTFRDDIILSETFTVGTRVVYSDNHGLDDILLGNTNKYARIETTNGVFIRRIDDATIQLDRRVRIIFDNDINFDITKISIIQKCRIIDDTIRVEYFRTYCLVNFGYITVLS